MARIDWERLVAEYRESGMSQAEFSRLRGVSAKSLYYQLQKGHRRSAGFARVETRELIELELRGGVMLRVAEQNLAVVLKALQS